MHFTNPSNSDPFILRNRDRMQNLFSVFFAGIFFLRFLKTEMRRKYAFKLHSNLWAAFFRPVDGNIDSQKTRTNFAAFEDARIAILYITWNSNYPPLVARLIKLKVVPPIERFSISVHQQFSIAWRYTLQHILLFPSLDAAKKENVDVHYEGKEKTEEKKQNLLNGNDAIDASKWIPNRLHFCACNINEGKSPKCLDPAPDKSCQISNGRQLMLMLNTIRESVFISFEQR